MTRQVSSPTPNRNHNERNKPCSPDTLQRQQQRFCHVCSFCWSLLEVSQRLLITLDGGIWCFYSLYTWVILTYSGSSYFQQILKNWEWWNRDYHGSQGILVQTMVSDGIPEYVHSERPNWGHGDECWLLKVGRSVALQDNGPWSSEPSQLLSCQRTIPPMYVRMSPRGQGNRKC